ncbi:Mitosis inhibitor nif1 [Lachnellula suecica]|uniref:Mitosis inhibitor nif1 n=1 Tax=Lachnellula suecica TaxID=602035 RepID=A0A8T9C941_9HELO|nr:Mitosis inhibitor nif1 [Lachnellula suecica]
MANRPNFIDLRSQSHGPMGTGLPSPRPLPSPRLHIAGDVPPELSPLDAFAAQSRRLAKQLEQSMNGERRMSRLPPLTIASSLREGRPAYFRSASAEAASGTAASPTTNSPNVGIEVEAPVNRPISVYPLVSGAQPSLPPEPSPRLDPEEQFRGRRPASQSGGPGYFGARTEQSPPALEREQRPPGTENSPPSTVQPRPSAEYKRQRDQPPRRLNDVSLGMGGYDSRALAPPRSPFAQRTPSPRSMSNESSDEDGINSNPSHALSSHRKLSSSSGLSTSPISPTIHSIHRSPSISSEISIGGTRLPRPAFNFSRPLSRASASGIPVDIPSRQASSDSQPSFILADDTAHTPVSMHSEGFPDTSSEIGAAPSYLYSRFSLPRGKMLQRNSLIFQENLPQAQFSWEQPVPFSNVQAFHGGAPPSPPSRPSTSSVRPEPSQLRPSLDPGRPSFDPSRPSLDPGRPSLDPSRPSLDPGRQSGERGRSVDRAQSPSVASSGTIKAKSQHSLAPSAECSAEEHVSKAIEYHEAGALTKSTYHLRLAARQNHPTGMLLYALACRHGWGMRPNQREGVTWLRRAVDSASLEVADDEDSLKDGKTVDILERKTRKAQFALGVYELGVSHMNGWGIEQDKSLALRCFEIAGSWGDADALAEAGFCYAQGLGCKKDLKKSARLYRQAESKGISMVGNSWIYKAKYNDDGDRKVSFESHTRRSHEKEKEPKPRNKSRTRTMFGRAKTAS